MRKQRKGEIEFHAEGKGKIVSSEILEFSKNQK